MAITNHTTPLIQKRVSGIEPPSSAWKADILTIYTTRAKLNRFSHFYSGEVESAMLVTNAEHDLFQQTSRAEYATSSDVIVTPL